MKSITQLLAWVKMRPCLATAIILAMGLGAAYFGMRDAASDDHGIGIFVWMTLVGLLFLISMWKDRDKLISILLCSILACGPILANDFYAGVVCWTTDYCFEPAVVPETQNVFTIRAVVELDQEWNPQAKILSVLYGSEDQMVSFEEFNDVLATWGLNWTGRESQPQLAKNGQAVTANEVPFLMNSSGVTLFPDREQFRMVIECSRSLGEDAVWERLLNTSIPAGVVIDVQDNPPGDQWFYRVRLETDPFQPAAPGPVTLGVGLGLLIGYGYVAYRVVRACAKKKKQPKPTNAPPASASLLLP